MLQWKHACGAGIIALVLAWNAPVHSALADSHAAAVRAPRAVMAAAPALAPVEAPEPVTIILFGTGLAALAAAATVKRKR